MAYLSSCHEFHDQVVVLVVFVDIVEFDDIWVVDLLEDLNLVLECQLVFFPQALPIKVNELVLTSKSP